jgi:hypothetical protein
MACMKFDMLFRAPDHAKCSNEASSYDCFVSLHCQEAAGRGLLDTCCKNL